MTLRAEVLFGELHKPLAPELETLSAACSHAHIVTGFATIDGIHSLPGSLFKPRVKLETFVVGAGTQRGFDAIDDLMTKGISQKNVLVHLGYSRETTGDATYRFYRYHPMPHGKVFLFENEGWIFFRSNWVKQRNALRSQWAQRRGCRLLERSANGPRVPSAQVTHRRLPEGLSPLTTQR